jgi:hypothetical protein
MITERSCYVFRVSLPCSGEFATGLNPTNAFRTPVLFSLLRSAFFTYCLQIVHLLSGNVIMPWKDFIGTLYVFRVELFDRADMQDKLLSKIYFNVY